MKQKLRWISLLLVLLMILPLAVACNDKNKKDQESKETQKETERVTEAETETVLTDQELEQLKAEMSESIMSALEQSVGDVEVETETNPEIQTEANTKEEVTTEYAGIVEGLLGSLGGLGNGDYNYFEIIDEVLDLYIGTNSTSEFIIGLIKTWIGDKINQNQQNHDTEEVTTELDTSTPGNSGQALQEFIADRTAQAVAEAIMDRMGDIMGDTMMVSPTCMSRPIP